MASRSNDFVRLFVQRLSLVNQITDPTVIVIVDTQTRIDRSDFQKETFLKLLFKKHRITFSPLTVNSYSNSKSYFDYHFENISSAILTELPYYSYYSCLYIPDPRTTMKEFLLNPLSVFVLVSI